MDAQICLFIADETQSFHLHRTGHRTFDERAGDTVGSERCNPPDMYREKTYIGHPASLHNC
jgi:hypothetical protein